jgi:hypothetical protein
MNNKEEVMPSKRYHPRNVDKPILELIDEAEDELIAANNRLNRHDPIIIQRTIPAQPDDTDVLIMDALGRAAEEIARLEALNAELLAENNALKAEISDKAEADD